MRLASFLYSLRASGVSRGGENCKALEWKPRFRSPETSAPQRVNVTIAADLSPKRVTIDWRSPSLRSRAAGFHDRVPRSCTLKGNSGSRSPVCKYRARSNRIQIFEYEAHVRPAP